MHKRVDMEFKYLVQEGSCKETESNWHHFCSKHNIPLVITRKRTSLGDVEWDYITMNTDSDDFFWSQKDFIISELSSLLPHYEHEKTKSNIWPQAGYAKNLPIEYLEDFALDVCNTLMEAQKRHANQSA